MCVDICLSVYVFVCGHLSVCFCVYACVWTSVCVCVNGLNLSIHCLGVVCTLGKNGLVVAGMGLYHGQKWVK